MRLKQGRRRYMNAVISRSRMAVHCMRPGRTSDTHNGHQEAENGAGMGGSGV
jgi:hypothetical protein